ncbi:MAG: hypothetical protein ACYTFY_23520, partial [Planctomycetota bacterium]
EYDINQGDFIYYHESEKVLWQGKDSAVEFYSIGFLAPSIIPPPVSSRVFPAAEEIRNSFEKIYNSAHLAETQAGACVIYGEIFNILLQVAEYADINDVVEQSEDNLWHIIEQTQQLCVPAAQQQERVPCSGSDHLECLRPGGFLFIRHSI